LFFHYDLLLAMPAVIFSGQLPFAGSGTHYFHLAD